MIHKLHLATFDKMFFVGRTRSGKSFLASHIHRFLPHRIIFDLTNEYQLKNESIWSWDKTLPDEYKLLKETRSFDDLYNHLRILKYNKDIEYSCLLFKVDKIDDDFMTGFDWALDSIYETGNINILIDEIQNYATPRRISPELSRYLTSGRHKKCGLFSTSQRPHLTNNLLFNQSENIFCGNLLSYDDSRMMSKLMNVNQAEISSLQQGDFFWFNPQISYQAIKFNSFKSNFKI